MDSFLLLRFHLLLLRFFCIFFCFSKKLLHRFFVLIINYFEIWVLLHIVSAQCCFISDHILSCLFPELVTHLDQLVLASALHKILWQSLSRSNHHYFFLHHANHFTIQICQLQTSLLRNLDLFLLLLFDTSFFNLA